MTAVVPILDFANATFLEGRNTTVRRGARWYAARQFRLQE